jgi:nucleotide-binding universal stress UspA family protein
MALAAAESERQQTAAVAARLDRDLDATGLAHEVRRVEAYAGYLAEAIARQARTSDLFLATRPYGDPRRRSYIEETALFSSGRPCFFVPPKGTPHAGYDTIFVAWKETREAARAVAESIPFLLKARNVVVAIVEEQGASERFGEEAGADIGRYLSRHGVTPEIRKINGWDYASAALENEIGAVRPDLVVMGGYGHSKLREWILGGATRDVLSSSGVPVLMAH